MWQQLLRFRYPLQELLYPEVLLVVSQSDLTIFRGLSRDALLCPSEQRCNLANVCLNKHQQLS